MSINGSKGRARYFARIKRELTAEAQSMGVDTQDRAAFHRWRHQRSVTFLDGLRDRLRCHCEGTKHTTITGAEA